MTGVLMPEYWADAELTTRRPRRRLRQWLKQPRRSVSATDTGDGGLSENITPDDAACTVVVYRVSGPAKGKGYLADIW